MSGQGEAAFILNDAEVKDALRKASSAAPGSRPLEEVLHAMKFSLRGDMLVIAFIHPYFAPFYQRNWRETLENAACAAFGQHISITYGTGKPAEYKPQALPAQEDPFAAFLCNAKNEPALAAARSICKPDSTISLLTLCGPTGVGKTMLLTAIRKAMARSFGSGAVYWSKAESFQPSLGPETFWKRHKALVLDDCHLRASTGIAGYLDSPVCQDNAGRHRAAIAFTGSWQELDKLESRLAARLRAGLVLELYPADLAMRMAYIEKTAKRAGLTRRQAMTIARFARDIPELAGLLQKLDFYGKITGQSLSPEVLDKLKILDNQPADWQRIVARVAEKTGVTPAEILGASRRHDFVVARMTAMYLCRKRLGLSYPEIGRLFGGRDHATVMYGIKKILELRQVDRVVHTLLTELETSG